MTMLLLNATRWSGRTYAEGRALGNGVLYAMKITPGLLRILVEA